VTVAPGVRMACSRAASLPSDLSGRKWRRTPGRASRIAFGAATR
jgi:hypothetical protein